MLTKHTLSCGCLGRENRIKSVRKHGLSKTRIYGIYLGMMDRCYDSSNNNYRNYGGRGISVCDEWLGDDGAIRFKEWAMNNGYEDTLTLDRIDVNGDYCPPNCRFATMKEQNNNKRDNVFIEINGERKTMKQWSEAIGIGFTTLKERIHRGWEPELAVLAPVDKRFSHS